MGTAIAWRTSSKLDALYIRQGLVHASGKRQAGNRGWESRKGEGLMKPINERLVDWMRSGCARCLTFVVLLCPMESLAVSGDSVNGHEMADYVQLSNP